MEPIRRSEESLELSNGVANRAEHVVPHRNDRDVVTQPVGFREHYEAGHVVHVHCRWFNWERPIEVKNFCLAFYWLFTCDEVDAVSFVADCGAGHIHPIAYDKYGAVFVDVVEFGKDPQRVYG